MKKDSPLLYEDLLSVWEGFLALNSSRVGLEIIQFSEIESWLNLNGIFDLDYRQEVAHLIRFIDSEYLNLVREKSKQK